MSRTFEGDDRRKLDLPVEDGYEIPVPNRDTFLSSIEWIAPAAGKGVTQEAADSATQPEADATNEG